MKSLWKLSWGNCSLDKHHENFYHESLYWRSHKQTKKFEHLAWLYKSRNDRITWSRKAGHKGVQHGARNQQNSSLRQRRFPCSNWGSCQCIFKYTISSSEVQVRNEVTNCQATFSRQNSCCFRSNPLITCQNGVSFAALQLDFKALLCKLMLKWLFLLCQVCSSYRW